MMERDFLGMSGGKEDTKGSRHDAGSAVRWPFTNKASAMQQFMLHKAAQEERANNYRFDRLSSPTFHPVSVFDAFEADRSDFSALAQQRSFSLHDYQPQATTTFSSSTRQSSEAGTFPVVSHHSLPITTNSPFFKIHGTQSAPNIMITNLNQQPLAGVALNTPVVNTCVGALPSWNMPKPAPTSAQLTIFYAGTVNVYDDVSFDKAQAILMLASKGSNGASNASRSEAPLSVTPPVPPKISGSDGLNAKQILNPTPIRVASPCSVFSNPIPVTLHTVANSSSVSSTKNDSVGAKVAGTLSPSTQQGPPRTSSAAVGSITSAAIMPRAVPQARKASLARFLEKRKERVNDAMPYSCIKKTSEIGSGLESAGASSISSLADVNVSSNREDSSDLRNQKSGISYGDSLSTKLRI
ncbi:protein TIFY 6b-like isoform X1 [Musa acuminata AAA Group]|uniref:protein TIFY 6b-like isoform X1 n=2 Tax=Musa acuminata AAA Group TaxID=214697 RepID=UPI0031DE871B